jgi:signal transduction histidine kinase
MLEELGLPSAMRWHLDGFGKRSGIATTREIADIGRLPQDVELALFRVFQESLTNLHRHCGSKVAHVYFQIEGHRVVLEIKDNSGPPFPVAGVSRYCCALGSPGRC